MIEIILTAAAVLYLSVLLWLRRGLSRVQVAAAPAVLPSVSVVISLHNEEKNVKPLIACLASLDYPADKIEFILISDRSSDRTEKLLQESAGMIKNFKFLRITDVKTDFAPKKFALDLAIRQAGGAIILLTDADGRPGKNWVHAMVAHFSEETGMVLGHAPYSDARRAQSFGFKLLRLEYFSHAAIAAATTGYGFPLTCVGTNLAYRKAVYLALDGFGRMRHIHTGDDDLFLQRVRDETNWKISYAADPRAFVPNAPPHSWRQFYQQRLRYASKGFVYPAGFTRALAAFYFFNLSILSMLIMTVFGLFDYLTALAILVIKLTSDFLFLKAASKAFSFTLPDLLIPVASLLHIPYVLYFGFMANFHQFEWGGLKHRTGG